MKVLFTGMEWFPECRDGGLDRYLYEEIQALAGMGLRGTSLFSSCGGNEVGSISVRSMAAKDASLLKRLKGARFGARQAIADGTDLVNTHFALYAYPWLKEIPAHVPLVVNFQGPWADEMRWQSPNLRGWLRGFMAERIERVVYRRADRIITLSQAFAELVQEKYGVDSTKVRVIPGALDLTPYLAAPDQAEARKRLGWGEEGGAEGRKDGATERQKDGVGGRPILLSVRRLAKRMGLDLLIEAMADVAQKFPEVLLLIGGKGPESERLKSRATELRLNQNVRFLGFIPESDLPTFYAAADFSVVPTVALEGFGLVTVESLACGTPVLGTPVGATPEILLPLDPNCVFEAATPEAMASRIKAVLRGDIRLPTSETCRAYVQRYGWPAVVPKILEVFEEAIEEKKRSFGTTERRNDRTAEGQNGGRTERRKD